MSEIVGREFLFQLGNLLCTFGKGEKEPIRNEECEQNHIPDDFANRFWSGCKERLCQRQFIESTQDDSSNGKATSSEEDTLDEDDKSFDPEINESKFLLNLMTKVIDLIKFILDNRDKVFFGQSKMKRKPKKGGQNSPKILTNVKKDESTESWDKLSAWEKIQKKHKWSITSQNPPNCLFKKLDVMHKRMMLRTRQMKRKTELLRISEMVKSQPIQAAKDYDLFFHYKDKDNMGYTISLDTQQAKMWKEMTKDTGKGDDDYDTLCMAKKIAEENWMRQAAKGNLDNFIWRNGQLFETHGRCIDWLKKEYKKQRNSDMQDVDLANN